MSKKKHPEHVNHERWLVSYADFITLLFAFFVVLFASSQSDKHKQAKLAAAMQTAFEHNGIFDAHTKIPPMSDEAGAASLGLAAPIALPLSAAVEVAAEQKRIEAVVAREVAAHKINPNAVSLHPGPDGLVVSLREAGFFASGSAEVRPESLVFLHTVAAALPQQAMRVEGHTDDVPIHTLQFATNWELSTARAAMITRLLIEQGTAVPAQISAAGYAENHPVGSNLTEAGRSQNRRVDIVLLGKGLSQPAKPVSQPNPGS